MKNLIWKIVSLLLLLIILVIFFYKNLQTTSEVDLLLTVVNVKTWKLIVISFFLGGAVFCGIASMFAIRKRREAGSDQEDSPGSEGSS